MAGIKSVTEKATYKLGEENPTLTSLPATVSSAPSVVIV